MELERLKKEYLKKFSEEKIEKMLKNGFKSYNLLYTIYIKEYFAEYKNILEYLGDDFFLKTFKIINNIDIKEISKENLENLFISKNIKDKIILKVYSSLFNITSHLRYYKIDKDKIFKKFEKLQIFLEMDLSEFNDNIFKLKEELEEINLIYKEKYEREQKILLEIINPIYIEQEYPLARKKERTVYAYLGPTNSGKTHQAITLLKQAKNGIYLAPLRLLAREIYDDLIASGIKTSLITGEEKIIVEDATHICCTIEMLDINKEYEVAVIDEIQFLADEQRGSSWSRALIGLESDKIITIGSNNAEYLIKEITNKCNDKLEIKHFNRLSPLEYQEKELNISNIEKGDAVIAFSRQNVHEIKEKLEQKGFSVSLIYGALPPEVRIKESIKFNKGKTEVLVATDAIGYGLNLNIKRVVFAYLKKYNGYSNELISQSLFNQIAGRAGRYGKIDKGFVSYCKEFEYPNEDSYYLNKNYCQFDDLDDDDDYYEKYYFRSLYNIEERNSVLFSKFAEKLNEDLEMLKTAFYFPEYETLRRVAEETNSEKSLNLTLCNYNKIFKNKNSIFSFKFSDKEETINTLDRMDFSFYEKYILMFAPVNKSNYNYFLDSLKNILLKEPINSKFNKEFSLNGKEVLASKYLLYMWLAQRFPELATDYENIQNKYKDNSLKIISILQKMARTVKQKKN